MKISNILKTTLLAFSLLFVGVSLTACVPKKEIPAAYEFNN